ncbi:MAG: serine--tRNA ligase, partial [Intrasporangium sp.]|nr:serine--tRNA ligase [Intrasporangium sp.]
MIDIKLLRDDPDRVRASQLARGEDPGIVDAILAADERRRSSLGEFEALRAEQKAVSKDVGAAMAAFQRAKKAGADDAGDLEAAAHAARTKAAQLSDKVKALESMADEAEAEFTRLLRQVGNVIIDGVPHGGEDDYVVLETVGTPRDFAAEGFEPLDHLALGERLGAIDMERGAKVAGARFYYLTGVGALLELAVLNLAMAQATAAGFTPMITPTMARPEIMLGAGYIDSHVEEVYHLDADDLYLTGTSEVALAGYHADEIIDLSAGPRRYAGWSA